MIICKTLGWSFYFISGLREEVLDFRGFEKTQTFKEYDNTYKDIMLLISTNNQTRELNVTLAIDSIEMYKESLSPSIEDSIYINTSKCNVLDGVGNTSYYFLRIVQ